MDDTLIAMVGLLGVMALLLANRRSSTHDKAADDESAAWSMGRLERIALAGLASVLWLKLCTSLLLDSSVPSWLAWAIALPVAGWLAFRAWRLSGGDWVG